MANLFSLVILVICIIAGNNAYSQALPVSEVPFSFSTAANESRFLPFQFNNSNYTNFVNSAKSMSANDGAFFATATKSVPVGGGRFISAEVKYGASAAEVAGVVGRFLGKIVTPLAVGYAAYDLARDLGLIAYNDGNSVSFSEQTVTKPTSYTSDGYRWVAGSGPEKPTKEQACSAWASILGVPYISASDYCYIVGARHILWQRPSECAAGTQMNVLGDCSPGALQDIIVNTPLASEQVLQKALSSNSALPKIVSEAVKAGDSLLMSPDSVTGPAYSPGSASVTSNPDGSKTVTNVKNSYSYDKDSVKTTQKSTTTVLDPATGEVLSSSSTDTNPVTDSVGLCDLYPDILACAKLDTPEEPQLPTKNLDVSISPDSGWGGSAACPAPKHIYVSGRDVPIPYDLFCMWADMMRPILLAFAWLSAAFILVGGVKEA